MKKWLFIILWITGSAFSGFAVTINVTFQVHYQGAGPVYAFGSWSNWVYWPGTIMTNIGNDIYSATLQLNSNTTYEFLYVSGTTPVKEQLNPTWPCTNGNGQYTNRVLTLGANDTTICYNWGTCASCSTPVTSVNVTFQVKDPATSPVYLFGSWSGWGNWPGTPMTSVGNNTYETSISLLSDSTYEYLFVNGSVPVKEQLDPAWSCTNGNGQYTNRVLTLDDADTTVCYTWASCNSCNGGPTDPFVTFRVHNPDSTPVFLFGSWSQWLYWPGTPMTYIGDNTYEATLQLSYATPYEYLFVNGNTPVQEVLDSLWPCTNGNGQYTNRVLPPVVNDTTVCYHWGSCSLCSASTLSGTVSYLNSVSSPMDSVNVYLCVGSDTVAMAMTDALGQYSFTDVLPGTYTLKSGTAKAWNGGNAVDGLLILSHFAGLSPLGGLPLVAADCDASGYVNAVDALLVVKRFVGIDDSFPAGDWAFDTPSITVLAGNVYIQNLQALCFGDVNGSNEP